MIAVSDVPWWGLCSSGAAPVLMVGGWTAATSLQPRPVDPVAETVSVLAAVGAAERWVMTGTFLAVGVCYIATGLALRPAGAAGRLILVAGAGVGMLVAAFPQSADGGGSLLHAVWASAGAVTRPGRRRSGRLRRLNRQRHDECPVEPGHLAPKTLTRLALVAFGRPAFGSGMFEQVMIALAVITIGSRSPR